MHCTRVWLIVGYKQSSGVDSLLSVVLKDRLISASNATDSTNLWRGTYMSNATAWNWVATVYGAIRLCGRAKPDVLARGGVLRKSQPEQNQAYHETIGSNE